MARRHSWKYRFYRFLRVKPLCNLVFALRFFWWVRVRRRLRVHPDMSAVGGHDYSVRSLLRGRTSDRILKLIMPLSAIDRMREDSRVLSVGCRYETDLLYLAAYGFDADNVRGLDMLSYSPWVDLGNMHAMPYPDSSWDAVVLGWVLTYSTDPRKAALETVRVVKPDGLVAVGISTYPQAHLDALRARGELMGTTGEVHNVDDMLRFFEPHVGTVYFRHDRADPATQGPTMAIFSVRK